MFGSNRAYDQLSARNVELARQVKELSDENKELKDIRVIANHNNTVLINKNQKQDAILKEITKLTEINSYRNEKVILAKIKELVCDYQSKN